MTVTAIDSEEICRHSLNVLKALKVEPVEIEVSLMYLDPLVELARGGEVEPIDLSDPHGGCGPLDLWVATVVPVVTAALVALASVPETPVAAWRDVEPEIHRIIDRVQSLRAQEGRAILLQAVRCVLLETPSGEAGGSIDEH